MNHVDINQLCDLAQRTVTGATAAFIEGQGALPARMKGSTYATEVDDAIEAFIRAQLSSETDIAVYGEESGGDFDPAATWVIDPIDGTSNYAAGNPLCAILLSLIIDSEPVIGITALPLIGSEFVVVKDKPALLNGIQLPEIKDRSSLIAQVGFSSVSAQAGSPISSRQRLEILGELSQGPLRPRITGSVGVDLAMCAQGVFDGVVSFSPNVWDNSAGVALVKAVGGKVTDLEGNPWTPQSVGVIAGTPSAHEEITATINKIVN